MLQTSGHEVGMIPSRYTASLSPPKLHGVIGLPFVVMVLLAVASTMAGNAVAEELAISAKPGARLIWNEFSQQMPRVRVATLSSRRNSARTIVRPPGANEFIPTAEARSDITSVKVVSPSLAGENSETGEDNFLGPDNSSNLLLPGNTGKYADSQTASGVVVDGSANGNFTTSEVAFSNNDFLGHIREFLQTKK